MTNTPPNHTIQRIMCAWSRSLELEQSCGESIVTQQDLDRVTEVLSRYTDAAPPKISSTPILHDSNTQ
jgi:hypothetical protein